MIGLDTNVLARYIVRDDAAQAALADRCVEDVCTREQPGFVSQIVLAELAWVLVRGYGYTREAVGEVISTLLSSEELQVQGMPAVRAALAACLSGKADFADSLIGAIHAQAGCDTTWTFDRKAAQLSTHSLLR